MKACELKRGQVLNVDGRNIFVKDVQAQTGSSRSGNTLYKTRGYDLVSLQKFERAYKGDEVLNTVDFERRAVQYLYRDNDGCTFMDNETYEQHTLSLVAMEDNLPYMTDGLEGIYALVADGTVLGVELPATVILTVTDCVPALKTASASARSKPATLNTGLVIQVPEFITPGGLIKVNTVTGEYMSRA